MSLLGLALENSTHMNILLCFPSHMLLYHDCIQWHVIPRRIVRVACYRSKSRFSESLLGWSENGIASQSMEPQPTFTADGFIGSRRVVILSSAAVESRRERNEERS